MVGWPNVSSRRLEDNPEAVLDLARAHRGCSAAVFGSVARGDATEDSDTDLLVEFEPTSSPLDLIELEEDCGTFSAPRWTSVRGQGRDMSSWSGLEVRRVLGGADRYASVACLKSSCGGRLC